ncbi:hypothetical protein Poly41_65410 [Novipirellula artificiosorum]|uniref:Uncharacterized protein n=1 Tax=Novipirellula artificiosorum TaxID=2528016 RepID=A0A5C6D589_9BACT|nr:hypothetical protein Poly41_65410 [Novipirellula artificiosorum]
MRGALIRLEIDSALPSVLGGLAVLKHRGINNERSGRGHESCNTGLVASSTTKVVTCCSRDAKSFFIEELRYRHLSFGEASVLTPGEPIIDAVVGMIAFKRFFSNCLAVLKINGNSSGVADFHLARFPHKSIGALSCETNVFSYLHPLC